MPQEFIETKYGDIPAEELIFEEPPEKPSIPLPSYLRKLYLKEIDDKTYPVLFENQGKYVLLDEKIANENSGELFKEIELYKARGSKPVKLPKEMNPKLAYFAGYFLGDGGLKDIQKTYLKNKRFEHKIEIADEFLPQIEKMQKIFWELFGTLPPIRYERIAKGEQTFYLNPTNKVVYRFLTQIFDLPSGSKADKLQIPKIIQGSDNEIKKWFVRGIFDAEGDTRAVEGGFKSQARVKIRMKPKQFIIDLKRLVEEYFGVSVNGPYADLNTGSFYIQIERHADIIKLSEAGLFLHPIKKWRLGKTREYLLGKKANLKAFVAEI